MEAEERLDRSIDDEAPMDVVEGETREPLPANACETVYVKNLNEDVKVHVMKQTLASLFGLYGNVLGVVAHRSVRMRGQAFVAFDSMEPAAKAVKEVVGFPLYGKPMQLQFARSRSDAVVVKLQDEYALNAHKKQRLQQKRVKRTQWRQRQLMQQRQGDTEGVTGASNDHPTAYPRHEAARQMPDEYLPPNRILFLHNVPDGVSSNELDALFRAHEGLIDVRQIADRGVAFVEFANAMQSSTARNALNGHLFADNEKANKSTEPLRITFAR